MGQDLIYQVLKYESILNSHYTDILIKIRWHHCQNKRTNQWKRLKRPEKDPKNSVHENGGVL